MAREFWEVFLPEDIIVVSATYKGGEGLASIKFMYPGSMRMYVARFVRIPTDRTWTLDSINEVN